jgi:hypothetical protein
MIGDKVKVQMSFNYVGEKNIPIYKTESIDIEGNATISVIGGVKPGSIGSITDYPVKVLKSKLIGYEKPHALGSNDTVLLFPIFFEHYQQIGWLPNDYFQIIS